jgi:hypothetical protein
MRAAVIGNEKLQQKYGDILEALKKEALCVL